jgi:hypothetical protein
MSSQSFILIFLLVDNKDAFKLTKSLRLDIMVHKHILSPLVKFIVLSPCQLNLLEHLAVHVDFNFHDSS